MRNSKATAIAALIVIFSVSCHDDPVRPGDEAPDPWRDVANDSVAFLVTLRGEDCLRCQTPSQQLRTLQERQGDSKVSFWAVGVGDDKHLVESYLRRERLVDFTFTPMTTEEYSDRFGDATIPSFYLISNGRIVATWGQRVVIDPQLVGFAPSIEEAIETMLSN